MTALAFLLAHLAAIVLVAASALALGSLLAGSLPFSDSLERVAFRGAIGLGALAAAVQALGFVGGIRPAPVFALLAAPIPIALWRRRLRIDPGSAAPSFVRGTCLMLALALAPAFLLALYPPTAFDATLYHLPFAKAFATRHATVFLPSLRFPVFPQLVEMLFTAALSISDDVTAQLIHFFCLALTTAALVAWGRRFGSARAGGWAAAAWLGSPIVLASGAAAYVDVGLALFCTMSLYAWTLAGETGDRRFLVWSAVLAGLGASTKYHGLFFVFAIPAALLISRPKAAAGQALRYLGIAVLALSPFYARIVLQTGNPLFPYFSGWFGPSAWAESFDPVPAADCSLSGSRKLDRHFPLQQTFGNLFLPGNERPRRTPLSPFLLLVPPLAACASIVDRRQRALGLVLLVYGSSCLALTPAPRYFFPVIPTAAILAASFADRLLLRARISERRQRIVTVFFAFVLILPGAAFGWRRLWLQGLPPVTPEGRETYLDRQIPVHGALRVLNETWGRDYTVYCLHCESAAYYAEGRFRGDHFGPYAFARVEAAMGDAPSLHAVLREMGVTHLLVKHIRHEKPVPGGPAFEELFRPLPVPPGASLYALR